MENSRVKKSFKNSMYASFSRIIIIGLSFIMRTIFIKTLPTEYLGINGLFSNIITMLSLADLGIGIAIPYTLYKPLAEKNYEKIRILMKFYSKIYNVIGVLTLLVGVLITPFLKYIIKEMPNINEIYWIYFLFVVNASTSYFFVYKRLLLDSDQKSYISSKITLIYNVLANIIQIIVLFTTHNYILYLIISIISVLLQNITISMKVDKEYGYIKEKTDKKIDKKDLSELKTNIASLMIYRIGIVVLNGTDNLIVSKILGIVQVGLYSNYLLIVNALITIFTQAFSTITASVGNLIATEDSKRGEGVLKKLQFINFWIYTVTGACIYALINPFIRIWIGQEFVLSNLVALVIAINYYIYGMQSVIGSYRDAYGLFKQGKYRPIIMVIVNIVTSIPLTQIMGIAGVVIGTIISRLFVIGIWDPIVVYKYGFKRSPKEYFVDYYILMGICIAIYLITGFVVEKVYINSLIAWVGIAILIIVIINLVLILLFCKDKRFKYILENLKPLVNKLRKK